MQTKNGIELDLKNSKYIYKKGNFSFYFSSEFYLKKFKEEVKEFVPFENQKIVAKYGIEINLCLFLMISLYKKIEKRGFLVTNNEQKIDNVKFNTILQN